MSQNKDISRRDFLKATLIGLGATFLAACGRALGITVTSSPTPARTKTNSLEITITKTIILEATGSRDV